MGFGAQEKAMGGGWAGGAVDSSPSHAAQPWAAQVTN